MNKRLFCIWGIVIALTMIFASTALASGYPMIAADSVDGILVVGKFDNNSFSVAEADQMSATIAALLGDMSQIWGPTQVNAKFGTIDGDVVKNAAKNQYISRGFDIYVFLNIRRTAAVSQAVGPNLRIDVYIADLAAELGIQTDYLYVASLEVPEMYLGLLDGLTLQPL